MRIEYEKVLRRRGIGAGTGAVASLHCEPLIVSRLQVGFAHIIHEKFKENEKKDDAVRERQVIRHALSAPSGVVQLIRVCVLCTVHCVLYGVGIIL